MISKGKVQVVVKSRRVPTNTVSVSYPIYTLSGIRIGTRNNLHVVYDSVLDDEHRRAIEEGRKLARNLGLDLQVVDASRAGLLGRFLSTFRRAPSHVPTLVVSPSANEPKRSPVRGGSELEVRSPVQPPAQQLVHTH